MLGTILEISLSTAVVILAILAVVPLLEKRYSSRGRRILWLILAVRLLIPINISLPTAPITLQPQERTVVLRTNTSIPVQIMTEPERAEAVRNMTEPSSANYAPLFSLEELLTFIWLAGALVFMLYHLISYWIFRFRIRKKMKYEGEHSGLKYYRCPAIESPIMTGFFRPAVLLPDEEYADGEKDIILRHEYTHFRRGDLWYKLILLAANAVHWFNPAVYLMARRANKDLEYSCDEAVVKGEDFEFRRLYSLTILKTMKRTSEPYLTAALNKEE